MGAVRQADDADHAVTRGRNALLIDAAVAGCRHDQHIVVVS